MPKPIFALAPMEAVTDVVFREMVAKYSGKQNSKFKFLIFNQFENENVKNRIDLKIPHPTVGSNTKINPFVMFTEFINVDGLLHPEGYKKLKIDLLYTENQRPIVCQIWGTDPEKFKKAASLIKDLGFDGVDINMGCPQDKEIGIGACAALIKNPKLAGEIIEATMEGAGGLPVSVKTRLGYSKIQTEEWIGHLLSFKPAAITIHARTQKEKSKAPAHWEEIGKAVEVRNQKYTQSFDPRPNAHGGQVSRPVGHPPHAWGEKNSGQRPLILGNGDVKTREEGLLRISETGCDGVMIARGAFGNPWLFLENHQHPAVKDRLLAMVEHAEMYENFFQGEKPFVVMRKNFKAYCSGFPDASDLRVKLMETENAAQVRQIVEEYLKSL